MTSMPKILRSDPTLRSSGSPTQQNQEARSWRVRSKRVLSTAMDKTNAVTIWIMDVHFAIAPALISRFHINDDASGLQFFIERIHIFDPKKDYSARHSITSKRGNMHR